MFKKLLIPLDGTSESVLVLEVARAVAQATGATLTLLYVVPAEGGGGENVERLAQFDLDRTVDELRACGLTVDTLIQAGDSAEEIVELARAQAADLIVMRFDGRTGVARAVLGRIAESLRRERERSVLPVPSEPAAGETRPSVPE